MDSLTEKEKLFVSEYLRDFSTRKAALRVGLCRQSKNAHRYGAAILKKQKVQRYIREQVLQQAETLQAARQDAGYCDIRTRLRD